MAEGVQALADLAHVGIDLPVLDGAQILRELVRGLLLVDGRFLRLAHAHQNALAGHGRDRATLQ